MNNLEGQCNLDTENGQFSRSVIAPPVVPVGLGEPQEIMDVDSASNQYSEVMENNENEMVVDFKTTEALSKKVFENEMVRK